MQQDRRDLLDDKSLSFRSKDEELFQNSSDDVRYLAMQNRLLMERLTIAESDIAALKKDNIELKEDYSSLKESVASCFESNSSD